MRYTIHDIKRLTTETEPHFFDRDTLKFFRQTLESFTVHNVGKGAFISAPILGQDGIKRGETKRYFNSLTNELEIKERN